MVGLLVLAPSLRRLITRRAALRIRLHHALQVSCRYDGVRLTPEIAARPVMLSRT